MASDYYVSLLQFRVQSSVAHTRTHKEDHLQFRVVILYTTWAWRSSGASRPFFNPEQRLFGDPDVFVVCAATDLNSELCSCCLSSWNLIMRKKNRKKNELKSDYSQVEHASFWFAMYDLRNLKIKLAKIARPLSLDAVENRNNKTWNIACLNYNVWK